MPTRIIINGQTYNRLEDVPPEFRKMLEGPGGLLADANGNGIPDIVEMAGAPRGTMQVVHTHYTINGKEYTGTDGMPPEAREALEKATRMLEAAGRPAPGTVPASSLLSPAGSAEPEERFDPFARKPAGSAVWLLIGAAFIAAVAYLIWKLTRP